ncbi:MAG: hypothetical protein CVU16_06035 [Betaproteobacteria bacterium HGW-Betaproteobacteria-10]|nr:MAG: hypothetical protein CVU16_06035 [Betaproteobacteria bacterium HGW-Betaproteobacteria-10]
MIIRLCKFKPKIHADGLSKCHSGQAQNRAAFVPLPLAIDLIFCPPETIMIVMIIKEFET